MYTMKYYTDVEGVLKEYLKTGKYPWYNWKWENCILSFL